MASSRPPEANRITEAARIIDRRFVHTPVRTPRRLSDQLACEIILKDETQTPIKSFKGRGTEYFAHVHARPDLECVCASAGNFGQGLTAAMVKRGGRTTVFAAENANPLKIGRMRELGADVQLKGADFDEACKAAISYAEEKGALYVEDAAYPEIAEGAGTIARELTQAGYEFDAIYVPVGGGALINGIGTWLKETRPGCRVVGVCAEGAPAFATSWRQKTPIATPDVNTIADGIAIRVPAPFALETMTRVVDDMVTVSDQEILTAMRVLKSETGILTEPAGAAGLAAALREAPGSGFRAVATPLCGANLTDEQRAEWLGA